MVSIPKLLAAVSYCPLTGDFCWTDVVRGGALLGRLAGSIEKHGYVVLSIDGERCKAHRAAWLFVHGKWPAGVIDHINGNRTDNRISNLRCVSARQNRENQRLAADGVIFKQGNHWLPKAEHQHAGRFEVKTGESNGHAFTQMRFTPAGIAWVAKRFVAEVA